MHIVLVARIHRARASRSTRARTRSGKSSSVTTNGAAMARQCFRGTHKPDPVRNARILAVSPTPDNARGVPFPTPVSRLTISGERGSNVHR